MGVPEPSASARKIAVVEDEPSICDTLVYALEVGGFHPLVCRTGAEALRTVEEEKPALVLLDIGLPDMSGIDVCRELRKNDHSAALPVIFLTARGEEIDRVVGLEIGGDDYVTKPFSPRELVARVRAVLRRSPHPPPRVPRNARKAPIAPPRFAIDELRYEIRFHGELLPLSRYEFRILKTLLRNPGRVFTRAQLMDHAWEEPEASLERVVDSHIKSLRSKLRAIRPKEEPIRTLRGIGYALEGAADGKKA